MSEAAERLHKALSNLIESYTEIESELEEKFTDDEDSFSHAIIETLEGGIEAATEERGISTQALAAVFSNLNEALEQLDPSAFDEADSDDEDYLMSELDGNIAEYDMDDSEIDDME